jgi:type III secretory pathway component EscV
MTPPERPAPTEAQIASELASNAAFKPYNILAAVVALVVALVAGAPAFVALVVTMVVYAAAAARTMFDRGETERVTAAAHARAAARGDSEDQA